MIASGGKILNIKQFFEAMLKRIQGTANVTAVYGEPIISAERTVVPVAAVGYIFGLGFGGHLAQEGEPEEGGGGGGGKVISIPVGALEITAHHTKFIPFLEVQKLALAIGVGFILGLVACRKRK